ncbi:hypothetical protein ACFPRL_27430 [Pseudoclavibacter helvolus]
METGSMVGLHPAAALQSIDVVEGRATLSARLMSALIRKAGHKLEVVKSGSIPTGDYSVTVTGTRGDDGTVTTSVWDIHRAIRAGLVDSYQPNSAGVWEVKARSTKGNAKPWEAHAESMPVWRAISEVGREGFSDVLFGLYSTEEMRDAPFDAVDAEPEPVTDWEALADAESTSDGVREIWRRAQDAGQLSDDLRTALMARSGALDRGAQVADEVEDAEIVEDEPEVVSVEPAADGDPEDASSEAVTDWTSLADACTSKVEVKQLWARAKEAGVLASPIEPGSDITVKDYLVEAAGPLPESEGQA